MKKKVLFLLESLGVGGSEKKMVNIANRLAQESYLVHIAYLNNPGTMASKVSKDIKLLPLRRRHKVDIRAIRKYRTHINKYRIDVVVAVNLYPLLVHKIATLGLQGKPNLIVSINSMYTYMLSIKGRLQMQLYKRLLRNQCKIVFGCKSQMHLWVSKYRIPSSCAKVIYNGIDTNYYSSEALDIDRSALRRHYGIAEDEVVLGMVSLFRPVKLNINLIKVLEILLGQDYKVKALFAGDGTELKKCMAAAEEKMIRDKVIFLGNIDDVRCTLELMDVFLLPSQSETFSNAALEAMAMSKPVILSNVGGASEMVINALNGLLYPPEDINALAECIRIIIDNNTFDKMGKEGRKIVEKKFTINKMVEQYERYICAI